MKKNHLLLPILLVGIAFGTAWAIRGQFGHEPGAEFAGIIGGAALLLILVIIPLLVWKDAFRDEHAGIAAPKDKWALYFGLTIIVIILLPRMVQLMHGSVPNANIRFPIQP